MPTISLAQTVCNSLSPAQEQVIALSLKKYEKLKPLYSKLRVAKDSLVSANRSLHQVIVLQDSAQAQTDRVVAYKDVLYLDADTRYRVAQKKASSRGWLNVGLGALVLLLGAIAVR